jgi:hypothetical protein
MTWKIGPRAGETARGWLLRGGLALVGVGAGCAPSPRTVANVTTGITGCGADALVVFDYVKATRTWSASCAEKMYVCSDGRGDARCTQQQAELLDPEALVRAKALLQLPAHQRSAFVDRHILSGDWPSFAHSVAVVAAMNDEQLASIDPQLVYSEGSADLDRRLRDCKKGSALTFAVKVDGSLAVPVGPWDNSPPDCATAILADPELAPLRRHPGQTFVLAPGIFDIKPVERPTLAAAPATLATDPAAAANAVTAEPPASAELDAAVRHWLDQESASILACTGQERSAVLVKVSAEGKPELSLRGASAGEPEAGCVRNALAPAPTLPAGPAQILHVVKGRI